MKELLNRLNLYFEATPARLRQHKVKVLLIFVLSTIFVSFGISKFKIDMSMEIYFQKDDPVKTAYDTFRAQFGSDEGVYIVYEANDGDIFSEASLDAVYNIQEELLNYRLKMQPDEKSALDHMKKVKTIINVPYLEVNDDSLISRDFIGSRIPKTKEARELIRKTALKHPDYPLTFLSKDSRYGGIIIRTDFSATTKEDNLTGWQIESADKENLSENIDDEELEFELEFDDEFQPVEAGSAIEQMPEFIPTAMDDYSTFMQGLYAIIYKPEYTKAITIHPVGNPVLMDFFYSVILEEFKTVVLIMIILIIVVLWLLFRSISAVVWPLVIIISSVIWVIGIVGWTESLMTTFINLIIFLILSVGVADVVHIMSGYLFFRNKDYSHEDAMSSVFKKSGLACLLTSLTTAVGMLSLVFVPIVPVQNFGLFAALGVLFAFVFTIFVLPVLMDLRNPFSKRSKTKTAKGKPHKIQKLLKVIEPLSCSFPLLVITISIIISSVMVYGLTRIKVDSDLMEIIKDGFEIKDTYKLVDKAMMGTRTLEVMIDTGVEDGLKNPDILNKMEILQNRLNAMPLVSNSNSIVNVTKDTYKVLNENRDDMYIIPQDSRVLEQTLFMFNNANPEDRRQMVSDDYSKGHITVNIKSGGSARLEILFNEIQAEVSKIFDPLKNSYPDLNTTITGSVPLMIKLLNYISRSQIKSFSLAFLVISIILILIFGSKKVGTIAMIPNAVPVITLFGIMGLADISLDVDTLLSAPIIIGIVVDDTIHFITHYRAEVLKHGNIRAAIKTTILEVGQAIIFTSVILSAGFLVFMLSPHQGLSNVGLLSSISIFVALLADLFLLPSLLVTFDADFNNLRTKLPEENTVQQDTI